MKTVKTYMVRKPADIDEVKTMTRDYPQNKETVKVVETINLTPAEYKKVCTRPMDDYKFLKGKGGYDEDNTRTVVELTCAGQPSLYADPSGSSYCRYLGIEVQ